MIAIKITIAIIYLKGLSLFFFVLFAVFFFVFDVFFFVVELFLVCANIHTVFSTLFFQYVYEPYRCILITSENTHNKYAFKYYKIILLHTYNNIKEVRHYSLQYI